MRIDCVHGYFRFYEKAAGQVSVFASKFGLSLTFIEDHFTFETLADAPKYSIAGATYLSNTALSTFEGPIGEVMRENGLVYNFELDSVIPLLTVTRTAQLSRSSSYFVSGGLIIPGSITDGGSRVTDYSAHYDGTKFLYSGVKLV